MKEIKHIPVDQWKWVWTEVCAAFENNRPVDCWYSLCGAFQSITGWKIRGTATEMDKFRGDPNADMTIWFNRTPKNQRVRATFAAMFAAMTPKEFLEICNAPTEVENDR